MVPVCGKLLKTPAVLFGCYIKNNPNQLIIVSLISSIFLSIGKMLGY